MEGLQVFVRTGRKEEHFQMNSINPQFPQYHDHRFPGNQQKAGGLRHREDPKGAIEHCAAPRFSILVILYDFVPELRSQKAKASLKWMGMKDGIKDGVDKHPEGLESALVVVRCKKCQEVAGVVRTRVAANAP
ncbi:hypothetical protein K438DRAFT_1757840 [Mycena galopus ATCC 62051]|nr:hypothetical protein K438DRAFT_1757840 [Mycena galopus ATCC 62051]